MSCDIPHRVTHPPPVSIFPPCSDTHRRPVPYAQLSMSPVSVFPYPDIPYPPPPIIPQYRIRWFRRLTLRARHLRGLVIRSSSSSTTTTAKSKGGAKGENAESTAAAADGGNAGGGVAASSKSGGCPVCVSCWSIVGRTVCGGATIFLLEVQYSRDSNGDECQHGLFITTSGSDCSLGWDGASCLATTPVSAGG